MCPHFTWMDFTFDLHQSLQVLHLQDWYSAHIGWLRFTTTTIVYCHIKLATYSGQLPYLSHPKIMKSEIISFLYFAICTLFVDHTYIITVTVDSPQTCMIKYSMRKRKQQHNVMNVSKLFVGMELYICLILMFVGRIYCLGMNLL